MKKMFCIGMLSGVAAALLLATAMQALPLKAADTDKAANATIIVTGGGYGFVMYDPVKDRTWLLQPQVDEHKHAWVPVPRLEKDSEVNEWKMMNEARKKEGK